MHQRLIYEINEMIWLVVFLHLYDLMMSPLIVFCVQRDCRLIKRQENMDRQAKLNLIKEQLMWHGLSVVKSLGCGGFGEVVLACKNSKNFAVKCFPKNQISKHPELTRYIRNQYEVMKALDHPNVLKPEYNIDGKDYFFMVLEYCNMGNLLNEQVKKPQKVMPYDEAVRIAASVLSGLGEIHRNKFVHRDIKPQNILLTNQNNTVVYKIADFGFARPVENNSADTHCGTAYYMAPEILAGKMYGNAVDFWSLGVLLYFMLFGECPFRSLNKESEIDRKCLKGFDLRKQAGNKQYWVDQETFANLCDFFKRVFVIDPNKRMGFNDMTSHPIFAKYFSSAVSNKTIKTSNLQNTNNTPAPAPKLNSDQDTNGFWKQKHWVELEREKVFLLKECLARLATTHRQAISNIDNRDIWAASYYILKAIVYFTKAQYVALLTRRSPQHDLPNWPQFCQSKAGIAWTHTLSENLKQWSQQMIDFYSKIAPLGINVKGFQDNLTPTVQQPTFDTFKGSYRSAIGNLFKVVHLQPTLAPHQKLQLKLQLFCCHLINRIFEMKYIDVNFPNYKRKQLEHKSFIKWVQEQNRESLERTINFLNNKYMSGK